MDTSRKKFFWLDSSHSCTVCCNPSSDLKDFMNVLVHSYTYCSDRRASPHWTFIRRWISMGFTSSLLKKRMTEPCSSLVHVASGAAIFTLLLRRRVAFLHSNATVGHSSNHEYHCCQLTRQSSCVSNFYRTFNGFIWLSLVTKPTRCTNFSNLCWNEILQVSDSSSVHHQEIFTVNSETVYSED
jgi:hypothetical protein